MTYENFRNREDALISVTAIDTIHFHQLILFALMLTWRHW